MRALLLPLLLLSDEGDRRASAQGQVARADAGRDRLSIYFIPRHNPLFPTEIKLDYAHDMTDSRRLPRLLLLLLIMLGMSGCKNWLFDKHPDVENGVSAADARLAQNAAAQLAAADAFEKSCTSQPVADALKTQVFDAARRLVTSSPAPLNSLEKYSAMRLALARINGAVPLDQSCSGQMTLMLPPSVAQAFGGQSQLVSSVQYRVLSLSPTAQATPPIAPEMSQNLAANAQPNLSNNTNTLVTLIGTESISAQLANAANMIAQRHAHAIVNDAENGFGLGSGAVMGDAGGSGGEVVPMPPAPPQQTGYDCGLAKGRVPQMICQDADLARKDRALSSLYARVKSQKTGNARMELVHSQRAFLQERDACDTNDCVNTLYDERIAQLGDGR